jgi:hypothetical protein
MPNKKARQYTNKTIKRLFALSGNQCAKPGCLNNVIGEDQKTIVARICHINAAEEGGPRYDSNMDDDDRRSFDNLILLCSEHHDIIDSIDNESEYSVETLKKWKSDHESKMLQETLEKNPSLLHEAIDAICNIKNLDKDIKKLSNNKKYKIQEKIEHNNVLKFQPIINKYKIYYGKIGKLYNELDNEGSAKKKTLLENIELIYLKKKGNYLLDGIDEMECIRNNSDKILNDVEDEILSRIEEDDAKHNYKEQIELAVSILIVDAFIRCKILEKPSE